MSLILFWSAVALLAYTYAIFPALVLLRGRLFRKAIRKAAITPSVTMIIAAHNEGQSIGAKLDNILSLDYPSDRFEVMIISDGSTDTTEDTVRRYAGRGVRLVSLPRVGKAAALNAGVAASRGEILVFSDANSMFAPRAIRELVAPLADHEVGGVAGDQRYLNERSKAATDQGERTYWDFDRKLKYFESRAGNVISATGAIYAIRRSLFTAVPDGVTDDFVTSTRVIAQGYRLVFARKAVAYEPVARSGGIEFGRKVRVITRGLRGVFVVRELLNPVRYGFYAVQLLSHKVLRRLMVFPILVLMLTSVLLWPYSPIYQATVAAQFVFYGCAAMGLILRQTGLRRMKVFSLPFYFCMVNAAVVCAVTNLLRGRRIDRWEPQRAANETVAERVLAQTVTKVSTSS